MWRYIRDAALAVAIASAMVVAGVAVNQILDDGKPNWSWAYLAFSFILMVALVATYATQPPDGSGSQLPPGRQRMYLRQLRASVASMETIGVVTQSEFVLQMRQVYVDVSLRPHPAQDTAHDPGVGPAATGPVGERRSLESFLGGARVLAVIGAPGSGKTTLVRHTALAMCGRHWRFWRRQRLPVLLYLRDHARMILDDDPPGLVLQG